ncbi:SOS response-associated peptidase [Lactobacillus sp. PV037]|uniref:SOS response-associated peptidase family protein n=1 Tax=unclassified Lactobacillus TaxID=2620435 RepID=UPI00223FC09E|nr:MULTISPECIES: SOS response-associated peptidase family protein [unclassified Lactobacillus]QNQ81769.1 SOS response-associated peptidase [Lactobacillus sp. PV012]QNQ84187.1 SOS response-associated peptidase [Lactobacillus sp. PV037]
MCNHYEQPAIKQIQRILKDDLNLSVASQDFQEDFQIPQQIFPKKQALLLAKSSTGKWGFVPKNWGYSNPFDPKRPLINARIEKVFAGPNSMWYESFKKGRCIIVANQFFEAGKTSYEASNGKTYKDQYSFKDNDFPLTFIAGIRNKEDFAMVTTKPTPSYAQVHDRMPLVLNPDQLNTWLTQDITATLDQTPPALDKIELQRRS